MDTYFQFPDCQALFYDAVVCMTNNASSQWCEEAPACKPLIDAFIECADPSTCSGAGCSVGPDGSCQCGLQCDGLEYIATCKPQPGGAVCECYVNASLVGKCDSSSPDCDPYFGCCSQFFGL
jgi:hypothetical protein